MPLYQFHLQSLPVIFVHILIEGRLVKQLRCEKLPQLDGVQHVDIAVVGDMLLTTQYLSHEILVFKLNCSEALR